jgi:hypothetical protein
MTSDERLLAAIQILGAHSAAFDPAALRWKDKRFARQRILSTLQGQRVTQAACSYKKFVQSLDWHEITPERCRRVIDLGSADELEQAREVLRRIPGVSANGMANQLGIGNARAAELLTTAKIPKRRCWFCDCEDRTTQKYDRSSGWNRTTEGSNLTRVLHGKDICDDCQRGYDTGEYRAVGEKLIRTCEGPPVTLAQILKRHQPVELVNLYREAQEAAA